MIDLKQTYDKYKADSDALDSWCKEIYDEYFSKLFGLVESIYVKVMIQDRPNIKFTDVELEQILTDVPLNLYKVSEYLNKLKVEYEMIKIRVSKERKVQQLELTKSIASDPDMKCAGFSKSDIVDMVKGKMIGDELLLLAYTTVIERVESERSAAKELIMAVKKIWDSRRAAERSNPVSEVVPRDVPSNIPPYQRDYRDYEREGPY